MPSMEAACQLLQGEHDFSSFEASGSPRGSSVRNVFELTLAHWQRGPFQYIDLKVSANGFLYHMVRNIAGAVVETGMGKHDLAGLQGILDAGDRRAAGITAPAHGLCLMQVDYPFGHLASDQQ